MLQLNRSIVALLLASATMAGLSACGERSDAAEPAGAVRPGANSYELVTVLRPESVENYFTRARGLYDLCAAFANSAKLPVKPFLVPPADFIHSRKTLISDGKSFLERETEYKVDTRKGRPEQGCEFTLASYSNAQLVQGGKAQQAGTDEDGNYGLGETFPLEPVELDPAKLEGYSAAKIVHGVALKCLAGADGQADTSSLMGQCIVDPAAGPLATVSGKPLVAYYRMTDRSLFNTEMVFEPVSLRVGHAVDAKVFTLKEGK